MQQQVLKIDDLVSLLEAARRLKKNPVIDWINHTIRITKDLPPERQPSGMICHPKKIEFQLDGQNDSTCVEKRTGGER